MSTVSQLVTNAAETTTTIEDRAQPPPQRWTTALFVQLIRPPSGPIAHHQKALDEYHAIVERAVTHQCGDVVAVSSDAALAVFSGEGHPQDHVQFAVDAATSMLEQVAQLNGQRLAQGLAPLRIGIGMDAGVLTTSGFKRHPLLDPGLEGYLNKARRLSDLNCQTPFPAIFVSHSVVNRLDHNQRYSIQNLGDVFVENQADPIAVYALMSGEFPAK